MRSFSVCETLAIKSTEKLYLSDLFCYDFFLIPKFIILTYVKICRKF